MASEPDDALPASIQRILDVLASHLFACLIVASVLLLVVVVSVEVAASSPAGAAAAVVLAGLVAAVVMVGIYFAGRSERDPWLAGWLDDATTRKVILVVAAVATTALAAGMVWAAVVVPDCLALHPSGGAARDACEADAARIGMVPSWLGLSGLSVAIPAWGAYMALVRHQRNMVAIQAMAPEHERSWRGPARSDAMLRGLVAWLVAMPSLGIAVVALLNLASMVGLDQAGAFLWRQSDVAAGALLVTTFAAPLMALGVALRSRLRRDRYLQTAPDGLRPLFQRRRIGGGGPVAHIIGWSLGLGMLAFASRAVEYWATCREGCSAALSHGIVLPGLTAALALATLPLAAWLAHGLTERHLKTRHDVARHAQQRVDTLFALGKISSAEFQSIQQDVDRMVSPGARRAMFFTSFFSHLLLAALINCIIAVAMIVGWNQMTGHYMPGARVADITWAIGLVPGVALALGLFVRPARSHVRETLDAALHAIQARAEAWMVRANAVPSA